MKRTRLALALAPTVALLGLVGPATARAGETLIAVATNFVATADALAPRFAKRTGHSVTFASGSTGTLHAQIVQGAPFDALLAADTRTPTRLLADGRGVPDTRFTYATGRLVLFSADRGRIGGDGAEVLRDPSTRHVAIAHPDLAPYGEAARTALGRLGLWDAVQPRIVRGQNVGQTFSLVVTGAADVGFVALSQLRAPRIAPTGSRWLVPTHLHDPIRQDALLLRPGADDEAALAFLAFLRGDEAAALMRRHGYGVD